MKPRKGISLNVWNYLMLCL